MNLTLKKMTLKNIGIHKDLEIEFGDFTEIVGKNATGKTTVEKAVMELIDGRQKHILNNKEVEGAIKGEFTGDTSILIPFSKGVKGAAKMIYKGAEITSPKKKLKEINTSEIRAIDFFSGEGAAAKKRQTEILLSVLKDLKLNDADIIDIAGEIVNEDEFKKLHPLDYINSLVSDTGGHYYKERHDNNEHIRTFEQTENTLKTEVSAVLHENSESFETFKPDDYEKIRLSDKVTEITETKATNLELHNAKQFVADWDFFFTGKEEEAKKYLTQTKERLDEKIKEESDTITKEIVQLSSQIAELQQSMELKTKRLKELKDGNDASNKELIENAEKAAEETLAKYKTQKDDADKILADKIFVDVPALEAEMNRIENIKTIIPTYKAYIDNHTKYIDMTEKSEELTEIITELRKLPKELIRRSDLPIDGLSMNEEGEFTMMNSHGEQVLLDQLSGTERLKLSLDISIARLGELKLLIIPDWNDVDDVNQKIIIDRLAELKVQGVAIAKENGVDKIQIRKR